VFCQRTKNQFRFSGFYSDLPTIPAYRKTPPLHRTAGKISSLLTAVKTICHAKKITVRKKMGSGTFHADIFLFINQNII